MSEVITIGLDIAKADFHAHGADANGKQIFSRRLSRGKLLEFIGQQPRCLIAMEACSGAHHWAREFVAIGHEVRLIPLAYVKPFVKRQKNDAADAEAICEAVQRPNTRQPRFASAACGENAIGREAIRIPWDRRAGRRSADR